MADAKKISYEAARDELADVVESLEAGSATLEESAKICQEWLDGAKKKLDSAKPTSDS
jgi:exodeoxyribonuclease VII small subunit